MYVKKIRYDVYLKCIPIGSMYGIFACIWLRFMVSVGKYTSPIEPMGNVFIVREKKDVFPVLRLFSIQRGPFVGVDLLGCPVGS